MPATLTCEEKMRLLAQRDASLLALLYNATTGVFRWFDRRETEGQVYQGPFVRVLRVSTKSTYVATGPLALEWPWFQLDCCGLTPQEAAGLAKAVTDWFGTVSFFDQAQFLSPPTPPKSFPNFQLNQRAGLQKMATKPVYVEMLDYRVANNLNF